MNEMLVAVFDTGAPPKRGCTLSRNSIRKAAFRSMHGLSLSRIETERSASNSGVANRSSGRGSDC
jgi:hypothetical protein